MKKQQIYPPKEISCKNNGVDLALYLFELSRTYFSKMREVDQRFVINMFSHLETCGKCSRRYRQLKEEYCSQEKHMDCFKPSHFKQIRENESKLKQLASSK